ncbi:MAG: 16S rRNA (cytosine(1402)-N(4))-methyltransferase, partial [Natronomonas sp.]|nr:16S rRNA (cytosine(1402)-N(4))-methyltransferase [Natronomonas sp.]
MARTVGDESATEDLDEATIHDVLRNDRRRLVIEALQQGDGTGTVGDLAEVVAAAHPSWERDRHPATRVFLAIRLHVNDELGQVR